MSQPFTPEVIAEHGLTPEEYNRIVELLERLADAGCLDASVACTHGLFTGKAVERLRGHPCSQRCGAKSGGRQMDGLFHAGPAQQ